MFDNEIDQSSYKANRTCDFDRLLAILWSPFASQRSFGRSCLSQHAVSIQIVSQIPQAHLGLHPDQTNDPNDQVSCPLRLHPKDVFHTTPNSGTRSIPLDLSIRQFLVSAPFALKMLAIFPLLQLLELFLRTIRRVRP